MSCGNTPDIDSQDTILSKMNCSLSSSERRKINKPIVEKRRRDRMNGYIEELQDIITSSNFVPLNNHSKLEKADILELTVKRLKYLEEKLSNDNFDKGYEECRSDLVQIIQSIKDVDGSTQELILRQLSSKSPKRSAPSVEINASTTSSTAIDPIRSPFIDRQISNQHNPTKRQRMEDKSAFSCYPSAASSLTSAQVTRQTPSPPLTMPFLFGRNLAPRLATSGLHEGSRNAAVHARPSSTDRIAPKRRAASPLFDQENLDRRRSAVGPRTQDKISFPSFDTVVASPFAPSRVTCPTRSPPLTMPYWFVPCLVTRPEESTRRPPLATLNRNQNPAGASTGPAVPTATGGPRVTSTTTKSSTAGSLWRAW